MRLDQFIKGSSSSLGHLEEGRRIQSSINPLRVFPSYRITYPESVVRVLRELYREYNASFTSLIEANREWAYDYQYCFLAPACPMNFGVQIDMVGLPPEFLYMADSLPARELAVILRRSVFEIENSLAMYQLLEHSFASNGSGSFFGKNFRAWLDGLRRQFSLPIALLAVTHEKYEAMRAIEFGKLPGEVLSDEEVRRLSGFDCLFGPDEFREHVEREGECKYLLYARTSDPVLKLKNPDFRVDHPLLADSEMRRIIRAHSLTLNIDNPSAPYEARINDTKEYMNRLGLTFSVSGLEDLLSPDLLAWLSNSHAYEDYDGPRLTLQFTAYLKGQEIDPAAVERGEVSLRGKPTKGTYGCYGHVRGALSDRGFRNDLRRNLSKRGPYVIQPEMLIPSVTNQYDGQTFAYIDRNFFGMFDGVPQFMGGFRSMMPIGSIETKNGRNHGSDQTVMAEIR